MFIDKKRFLYAGLFVSGGDKQKLADIFRNNVKHGTDILNNWKVFIDHCTMIFNDGKFDDAKSEAIFDYIESCTNDEHTTLTVDAIGRFENVYAFRIKKTETTDMLIKNKTPHITCVLDPKTNKPVDSNKITEWTPITPVRIDTVCKVISR